MYPIKVQSAYSGLQCHRYLLIPPFATVVPFSPSTFIHNAIYSKPIRLIQLAARPKCTTQFLKPQKKDPYIALVSVSTSRGSTAFMWDIYYFFRRLNPLILASTLFLTWNTQKRVIIGGFLKQIDYDIFYGVKLHKMTKFFHLKGNLFRRCKRIIHEARSYTIRFLVSEHLTNIEVIEL